MVFYSTKSKAKVFHLQHCVIIRRIRKENRMTLSSPMEARALGYRLCNCCSVVGMRYQKERKAIDQFCDANQITCWLEDGILYVRTSKSQWCMIVSGKANKLFLYHKNTYNKRETPLSIVPGYHSQAIRCKSIADYLDYIVQHDAFRTAEKERARRKAISESELRKNTRSYQRGTKNRRFSAGQLYSVLDDLDL